MKRVESVQELRDLLASVWDLGQGVVTNFYLDTVKHGIWTRRKILYYAMFDGVLFLFKEEERFYNLFYCSPSLESLRKALGHLQFEPKKDVVVDVVGTKKQCGQACETFFKSRFEPYCSLVRMSRPTPQGNVQELSDSVRQASIGDAGKIHALLSRYFDPCSEQIPFEEEISSFVEKGRALVCKNDDEIVGFLLYELNKSTLYLRYWFVRPDYRDKKVGSALMNRFFYEGRGTRRQLFWVIQSNENAIKRYRHYGFKEEDLYDNVLILKQDERANNKDFDRFEAGV